MWNLGRFGYGFGGFMMVWPTIFIVLIVVLFIKLFQNKSTPKVNNDRALDILKERFAKGEIDEEEFKRKKELLTK